MQNPPEETSKQGSQIPALKLRKTYHRMTWLAYFLFSISVLLFVDGSSPCRNWNPFPSPSMFILIGNGIFDGYVPYRDLWDGKGFLVFFIVGLASKIFPTPLLGSWVLSVVSVTLAALYFHKIARLFGASPSVCYAASIITIILTLLSGRMFAMGGVSDLYIMPLMSIGVYHSMKLFIRQQYSRKSVWAIGLCVSTIFWMKFTSTAALGVLCIALSLAWLKKKWYRDTLKLWGILAASFLLISLPIICYYAINDALDDLLYGYYFFHKLYHPTSLDRLAINSLLASVIYAPTVFCIGMSLGLAYIKWGISWQSAAFAIALAMMWTTTYIGSCFCYYLLPLMPFALMGVIFIFQSRGLIQTLSIMALGIALLCSYDTYLMTGRSIEREILEHRESEQNVREIISIVSQSDEKSVLYYQHMDFGLYNHLGIYPPAKYYQQANYDPQGALEQEKYLRNRTFKFVTLRMNDISSCYNLDKARKGLAYQHIIASGYTEVHLSSSPPVRYMLFERKK